MKTYVYRNVNNALAGPEGWRGEDVLLVRANSILEADKSFENSGLTFEVMRKGQVVLVPASAGVSSLAFISCRIIED